MIIEIEEEDLEHMWADQDGVAHNYPHDMSEGLYLFFFPSPNNKHSVKLYFESERTAKKFAECILERVGV